jgi:hypothetical protein
VESAIALRSSTFGKELPAHAPEQAARSHAEDLLGLGIEIGKPPLAVDRHESIADAFKDLPRIQRTGNALVAVIGQNAVLLFWPMP